MQNHWLSHPVVSSRRVINKPINTLLIPRSGIITRLPMTQHVRYLTFDMSAGPQRGDEKEKTIQMFQTPMPSVLRNSAVSEPH